MNDPVLVRSTLRAWDLNLLIVFGLALLAGAAVLWVDRHTALAAVLAAGGVFVVVGGVRERLRRIRRRLWLQDTGHGFRLIERTGEQYIEDNRVIGMSVVQKRNYSNGLLKSVTHHCLVWLDMDGEQPESFEMVYTIKIDALIDISNPLGGFTHRLTDNLDRKSVV